MNESPVSRKSSPIEQIKRIQSEQEANKSNESKASTPGYQLCRERPKHSLTAPSSNIIGVLRELKDDIVDCNQACSTAGRSFTVSKKSPTTGMGDVYIEQNGKFIKAPKELLEHCDFNTREVYLEEIGPGYLTPLDMAIIVEKGCSTFSRILLGILAGVAVLAFILIIILLRSWDMNHMLQSWPYLAILTDVCQTLFFVILTICLISMLDWLDLAHTNPQHMVDTLQRRKIFFVLVIYFGAMIILLFTTPYNDYVIHNMMKMSDVNFTQNFEKREIEVIDEMSFWKTLTLVYLLLCIIGWFVITLSRNEDLFYLHLLGMKKYEASGSQMTFENQMACCQLS